MKKFCLGLAMIASMVFAPFAMASETTVGKFVTSPSPLSAAAAQNQNKLGLTPTDIVVINISPTTIYYSVPNTNIDDPILSGYAQFIREYNRAFYMTVNIETTSHTVVWSRTVCPRAVVIVSELSPAGVSVITEHC
jgi:hypothetical protein